MVFCFTQTRAEKEVTKFSPLLAVRRQCSSRHGSHTLHLFLGGSVSHDISRLAHYAPSVKLKSFSATRTEFSPSFCHIQCRKKEMRMKYNKTNSFCFIIVFKIAPEG